MESRHWLRLGLSRLGVLEQRYGLRFGPLRRLCFLEQRLGLLSWRIRSFRHVDPLIVVLLVGLFGWGNLPIYPTLGNVWYDSLGKSGIRRRTTSVKQP